jgi:large subunit ribosomal protein L13
VNTLSYKTISVNKATAQKEWVIVDAQNQALGRLSSKVAKLLRGKYKPSFTPHVDCGDNVIVINADKVRLTGKKWSDREHFSHTGYQGGQVVLSPMDIFKKNPGRLIEKSVKGMLPKNILADKLIGNLYVYVGENHKHEGQQPKSIDINSLK